MVIFPVYIYVLWMKGFILMWSYDSHMSAIDYSHYTWHSKPLVKAIEIKAILISYVLNFSSINLFTGFLDAAFLACCVESVPTVQRFHCAAWQYKIQLMSD